MKMVLFLFMLCGLGFGQSCGVEPPDLAPVGMLNPKHVCACEKSTFNCHWTWVSGEAAISSPGVIPIDPALLNALAHPLISSPSPVPPDASRKCIAMNAAFGSSIDACMAIQRRKKEAAEAALQGARQRTLASLQLAIIHHPDFQTVYRSHPNMLNPSPAMESAIVNCQNPGELVYYLETHPEDYYRIASMKDRDQKREISKLDKSAR